MAETTTDPLLSPPTSWSGSRPRRPTRQAPPPPVDTEPTPGTSNSLPEDTIIVSSPVTEGPSQPVESPPSSGLTPLRAHYLKKALIQLEIHNEFDAITTAAPNNISTFSFLGPPFSPPPKDAPALRLPLLKFMFRQFVLTFPFMAAAPKDFYSEKLQPFMAAMLSRNLSPTSVFDGDPENSETATRMKLLNKLERNLALFMGSATKLIEPEEVVRLTQADLDRLEEATRKRQARNLKEQKDIFEVNIVGVRTVIDRGRVRSRAHEEFIIRTCRSRQADIFVSRRYGDFRTLAAELRKHHPNEDVRPPPPKDRTTVNVPAQQPYLQPVPSTGSQSWDEADYGSPTQAHHNFVPSKLSREKNRLTLRAYLHSLMTSPTIASSPVLKSFLLSGPISLSPDEQDDAHRREEADRVREEGRKTFAKEIAGRVDGLRDAVKSVKGDIMGKDGLTNVFATIRVTQDVRDLPDNYKAVLEWARMSLASTIFHHFVAADNASESFASLKRIHGLMPYFMLKTALKISNPIGMIRSILDLFLAQPFGGRSLLQRMFSGSLTEEVRALEEEIGAVKAKVDDPIMCDKVKQFVYAPREIQEMYKADAAQEKLNLLTIVLRSGDEPVLSRAQMHRVLRAHRAHAVYLRQRATLDDSDDDDGPQDDDAWLYEDLKVLGDLYSRLRDREQLIALIFEGFTADLLKDIITIFYAPLAQVYRAASIADSLGDMQSFINDLIRTVEQTEEVGQEDPNRTVQAFIDLVQRHEQSFYNFVHKVHSKGQGLFDGLMRWIELFLNIVREGLQPPISLEFLLPHTGQERADILKEVDEVALYHYKLKVLYETKLRKRFGRAQKVNAESADAEDEHTAALVNGVVGEIDFGELVQGDADDAAAEDEEEDGSDDDDYETGSSDDTSGSEEESSEEESTEEEERTPRSRPQVPLSLRSRTPDSRSSSSTSKPLPPQPGGSILRPSRSMNFMKRNKSVGPPQSRRTLDPSRSAPPVPPVPPVPSLPRQKTLSMSRPPSEQLARSMSKDLPPSPSPFRTSSGSGSPSGSISSFQQRPTTNSQPPRVELRQEVTPSRPSPQPTKNKKKKKSPKAQLKPPELKHIPKLLPVFSEMMLPLLRPRQ